MLAAEKVGQLISARQTASIKRPNRGSIFRLLYLIAIGVAMIGWLGLIPWLAIRLF